MRHLVDEDPPEGLYSDRDAVLIGLARALAGREHIDDALNSDLAVHFSEQQIIEICFLVGVQTLVTFSNKTFRPDVDERFIRANEEPTAPLRVDRSPLRCCRRAWRRCNDRL